MPEVPVAPTFGDLPQALVEDVLKQSLGMSSILEQNLARLQTDMKELRAKVGKIRVDREIAPTIVPTSCGIDGSYVVERLLSTDLAAFAALAVEGITPPSEIRFWPEPRHVARVYPIGHHEATQQLVRGFMMAHEIDLAHQAPHDVVMLDYSLRTPLIYLNNATSSYANSPSTQLREDFAGQFGKGLDAYVEIISATRRDKIYVGAPKYSSLRELSARAGLSQEYDDRTLATFILNPGEFIGPLQLGEWREFHLQLPEELDRAEPALRENRDALLPLLEAHCFVVYYKPRPYMPAYRLEVPESVAKNDARLGTLLRAIEYQSAAPGIFEPFPLYLADRMVKHLGTAFPAFLQAVTHEMASRYAGDIGEIYLAMHSYRSEGGR